MCGVIVVDAGRSRSTNLGCDAYIMIIVLDIVMIIWSSINCLTVICLPTVCYFWKKPLVKSMVPGLFSHHIYFQIYIIICLFFICIFYFKSILSKTKKYLAEFYLSLFYLHLPIYLFTDLLPRRIDNPSYASGCKYLFFVCRYHLHSLAWSSYWINTLVS